MIIIIGGVIPRVQNAIATKYPCVVPSLDLISVPPVTKSRAGIVYQFVADED